MTSDESPRFPKTMAAPKYIFIIFNSDYWKSKTMYYYGIFLYVLPQIILMIMIFL